MQISNYTTDTAFTLIGAATVAIWPGASALMSLPLLGIPLAALAAAMLGAGFSYLRRNGERIEAATARMVGIATDAFIGGWLAVALFNIPHFEPYGAKAIPIEVTAGLAAYLMQVIRQHAGGYFERAFQTALNTWAAVVSRGKNRGDETP